MGDILTRLLAGENVTIVGLLLAILVGAGWLLITKKIVLGFVYNQCMSDLKDCRDENKQFKKEAADVAQENRLKMLRLEAEVELLRAKGTQPQ